MTTSDKRPFTITYKHPGAQPPVYVAGSFTHPAWEPQELEAVPVSKEDDAPGVASGVLSDSSEYVFSKQFEIAVGDWQYKFRLGDGDWWVCDESADITTDNSGNQNNILVIKPQSKLKAHEDKHYHVGPHTGPRDSGHAWNSTGSSRVHDEATGDHTDHTREHSHKKQCNLIGHHNSTCLAHGVSSDSTCICNPPPTPSDNIITKEKLPAIKLPHSAMRAKGDSRQAALEKDTQLPLIPLEVAASTIGTKTPVMNIEEVTDKNAEPPAFEAHTLDTKDISKTGNRRMSAAIAERVKLLMSIPDIATAPISTVVEDPTANLKLNDPEATTDIDITPSTSHGLSPLFSHERLTPDDPDEIHRTRRTSSMSRPEKGRQFSHDYAPLEVFPSGAGPILKRIATTRSQLDADETTDEIVSAEEPSPVTGLMHSPTFSHERCPSEQSVLHSVGSPSESPLPPSISPAGSHERKRSDMDVISEQEDKDSSNEDEVAEKDSHGVCASIDTLTSALFSGT